MTLKAILCGPLGHHWHTVPTSDPFPVLECRRCGRRREVRDDPNFDRRSDMAGKTGMFR